MTEGGELIGSDADDDVVAVAIDDGVDDGTDWCGLALVDFLVIGSFEDCD